MKKEDVFAFAKDVIHIAVYPIAAALAVSVIRSFWWWGFFILALVAIIAFVVLTIVGIVKSALAIWRTAWRQAVIWAAVTCLTILSAIAVVAGRDAVPQSGDYLHLAVMYPFYAMRPEYRSGHAFSVSWTSEGFLMTQGCDRSMRFDPTGNTRREERAISPTAISYYNWISVEPLFLKFYIREDCFF